MPFESRVRSGLCRIVLLVACVLAAIATPALAGGFKPPVDHGSVVAGCDFDGRPCASKNNYYHTGTDWTGDPPVKAVADGVVEKVQPNDGSDANFGRTVILRHETTVGTVYSQYSHMSSFASGIAVGACVTGGQQLGTIGGSGGGSETKWDPHLHLEIKNAPVLTNPSNGGPYFGYTPSPAENYGYRRPSDFYVDKVATERECGIAFDQPAVSSSNVLDVTQGDTVRAVVSARYRGLRPLECGLINLGTKGDAPARFRADGAGPFPASQWRGSNRVAAFGCDGQLQPGSTGRWAPEFYVPPETPPGTYLAGEFHPVYDHPTAGGHSALNIPISLRVVPRVPPPPQPRPPTLPTIRKICLDRAAHVHGRTARAHARRRCRLAYARLVYRACLVHAREKHPRRAAARARKRCRVQYRHNRRRALHPRRRR